MDLTIKDFGKVIINMLKILKNKWAYEGEWNLPGEILEGGLLELKSTTPEEMFNKLVDYIPKGKNEFENKHKKFGNFFSWGFSTM